VIYGFHKLSAGFPQTESPALPETRCFELSGLGEVGVAKTVVGLLEFDGRIAVGLQQPVVVEPVDVVQGRGIDLLGGAPGAVGVDQLCFEQPDHRSTKRCHRRRPLRPVGAE